MCAKTAKSCPLKQKRKAEAQRPQLRPCPQAGFFDKGCLRTTHVTQLRQNPRKDQHPSQIPESSRDSKQNLHWFSQTYSVTDVECATHLIPALYPPLAARQAGELSSLGLRHVPPSADPNFVGGSLALCS